VIVSENDKAAIMVLERSRMG